MRYQISAPLAGLLLASTASTGMAEGRFTFRQGEFDRCVESQLSAVRSAVKAKYYEVKKAGGVLSIGSSVAQVGDRLTVYTRGYIPLNFKMESALNRALGKCTWHLGYGSNQVVYFNHHMEPFEQNSRGNVNECIEDVKALARFRVLDAGVDKNGFFPLTAHSSQAKMSDTNIEIYSEGGPSGSLNPSQELAKDLTLCVKDGVSAPAFVFFTHAHWDYIYEKDSNGFSKPVELGK